MTPVDLSAISCIADGFTAWIEGSITIAIFPIL